MSAQSISILSIIHLSLYCEDSLTLQGEFRDVSRRRVRVMGWRVNFVPKHNHVTGNSKHPTVEHITRISKSNHCIRYYYHVTQYDVWSIA